jgi:hypothetical protein
MTEIDIKKAMMEVLEQAGLITPYMSRKEVIKQIGRVRYERAVKAGLLSRVKATGKNSTVRILRSEFISRLLTDCI